MLGKTCTARLENYKKEGNGPFVWYKFGPFKIKFCQAFINLKCEQTMGKTLETELKKTEGRQTKTNITTTKSWATF